MIQHEYEDIYEKTLADIYCYDVDENALLKTETERNGDN